MFTKVSEAYDTLSDPYKRADYDRPKPAFTRMYSQQPGYTQPNFPQQNYQQQYMQFKPQQFFQQQPNFQNMSEIKLQKASSMGFPTYTKTHFGGFTFEMAEEVFKQAFEDPKS